MLFSWLEGFPRLWERAEAMVAETRANSEPEPSIICPSTQWYVYDKALLYIDGKRRERSSEAVRDSYGVWHICYSMHLSREELEWALQILAPKGVASTTPSCRAMELCYVKKNCSLKELSSKDSLWKLLGIKPEVYQSLDTLSKVISCSSVLEDSFESEVVESQKELIKSFTDDKKPLIMFPPKKKPSVTLFGRARLGIEDFVFTDEDEKTVLEKDHFSCNEVLIETNNKTLKETNSDITETRSKLMVEDKKILEENDEKLMGDFSEGHLLSQRSAEKDRKSPSGAYSQNGSSSCFSDRFRKMYRMINVPVPEPFPSSVELMKVYKRTKRD